MHIDEDDDDDEEEEVYHSRVTCRRPSPSSGTEKNIDFVNLVERCRGCAGMWRWRGAVEERQM